MANNKHTEQVPTPGVGGTPTRRKAITPFAAKGATEMHAYKKKKNAFRMLLGV